MKYWVFAVALGALGVGYLVQTELRIRQHHRELQAMAAAVVAQSTVDLRLGILECEHITQPLSGAPPKGPELCGIMQREINARTERMQVVIPQEPQMWIPGPDPFWDSSLGQQRGAHNPKGRKFKSGPAT